MSDVNEYTWHTLPNIGYIRSKFTNEELKPIRDEIAELQSNFDSQKNTRMNAQLAGNLEREFELVKSHSYIENLMLPYIREYDERFNLSSLYGHNKKDSNIVLDETWVNFQQKNEFNPLHNHSGIFSFVIWLNVPYDIDVELEFGPGKDSNTPCSGLFEFTYVFTNGAVRTHKIPVDKNTENDFLVFPSTLLHQVYPFHTSEGYRISVSGNFCFENDK